MSLNDDDMLSSGQSDSAGDMLAGAGADADAGDSRDQQVDPAGVDPAGVDTADADGRDAG